MVISDWLGSCLGRLGSEMLNQESKLSVTALQKGSHEKGDTCKKYCIFENTELKREGKEIPSEQISTEYIPRVQFLNLSRWCCIHFFVRVSPISSNLPVSAHDFCTWLSGMFQDCHSDLAGNVIANKVNWTHEEIMAWLDHKDKKDQDEYDRPSVGIHRKW